MSAGWSGVNSPGYVHPGQQAPSLDEKRSQIHRFTAEGLCLSACARQAAKAGLGWPGTNPFPAFREGSTASLTFLKFPLDNLHARAYMLIASQVTVGSPSTEAMPLGQTEEEQHFLK